MVRNLFFFWQHLNVSHAPACSCSNLFRPSTKVWPHFTCSMCCAMLLLNNNKTLVDFLSTSCSRSVFFVIFVLCVYIYVTYVYCIYLPISVCGGIYSNAYASLLEEEPRVVNIRAAYRWLYYMWFGETVYSLYKFICIRWRIRIRRAVNGLDFRFKKKKTYREKKFAHAFEYLLGLIYLKVFHFGGGHSAPYIL